jgi:fructosamine-3-kinase
VKAPFLEPVLRRALGRPDLRVTAVQPVGGGCIHHAARISTTTSGDVFAKWNEDCPGDLFLREADGLKEMRSADSGLVVPEVLAAGEPEEGAPAFIVMEYLPPGREGASDEVLGRGLAALHRRVGEAFGFPVTTYCGPTPQENTPSRSWPDFYAERRLRPLVRRLLKADRLGPSEERLYERLCDRLVELIAPQAPPSLIHGDLWSGNVLATARGPALVDPACAYADREMEFGITTLFGGFSSRFWGAYEESWPLPPQWRERNPVYQVYHLLNHHLIFGGHYGAAAAAAARRFV